MHSPRTMLSIFIILLASFAMGCGGSSNASGTMDTSSGTVPQFSHVVVVVEENASYSDVIGTSAMPYLNGLANQYGLSTSYYANAHPSIGNYFMMTTGTIPTNDDTFTGTVSVDNLVREVQKDGK